MKLELLTRREIAQLASIQPGGWSDITVVHNWYLQNSFCRCYKVLQEETLAGIGTIIFFEKTAWLAHIIVAKKMRRRGIGFFIVQSLIDKVIEDGFRTISLIATDDGAPVYQKAGFKMQNEYVQFNKISSADDMSFFSVNSSNIEQWAPGLTNDILRLDRYVSGEDRSILLSNYVQQCILIIEQSYLKACYFPSLQEGLIIAKCENAGATLLRRHISGGAKTVVVPSENLAAVEVLLESGYQETKRLGRMVYGQEFMWHPENLFCRIGGNFG